VNTTNTPASPCAAEEIADRHQGRGVGGLAAARPDPPVGVHEIVLDVDHEQRAAPRFELIAQAREILRAGLAIARAGLAIAPPSDDQVAQPTRARQRLRQPFQPARQGISHSHWARVY